MTRRRATCCQWKGSFGFLSPDDNSGNIFVYQGDLIMDGFRSLAIGDRVEYDRALDPDGRWRAVSVVKIEPGTVEGNE